MTTFSIGNLDINAVKGSDDAICYLLCPFDFLGDWARRAVEKYGVSVAVVTGMDWDNDLTPWPAEGEPPGSPDFRGDARIFLSTLLDEILPETEKRLGITQGAERTLAGVSLSGLFTLWQWMVCDTFRNIISLSGSFWYEGFAQWVEKQKIPGKRGRAYFLLGDKECKAKVKAFRTVQADTEEIVAYLRSQGIDSTFELVPGNHYQYGEQRLDRAFSYMFASTAKLRQL